jgi:hypothetical protein
MEGLNISYIIQQVCKHLNIEYTSKNKTYLSIHEDVRKMSKIYLELKQIIGILVEIEDRQDLGRLREKMEGIIQELNEADHLVIRLAKELIKEND